MRITEANETIRHVVTIFGERSRNICLRQAFQVFITQGELARNHQQMCVGSRRLPPPTAWRRLRQSISGELPKAEFNLDQIQEVVARRGPGAIDDLIAPGLDWAVPRLFIIDDAKPPSDAIRLSFGRAVVDRDPPFQRRARSPPGQVPVRPVGWGQAQRGQLAASKRRRQFTTTVVLMLIAHPRKTAAARVVYEPLIETFN
jgi:hypothetical protein